MISLIKEGDLDSAIDLFYSHFNYIFHKSPDVEFHLKHQKLIEMVRQKYDISAIIEFAQKNLARIAIGSQELLESMEQTLALSIFEEPHNSPFKYLLDSQQVFLCGLKSKIIF